MKPLWITLIAAAGSAIWPGPAHAQRLLDWPVRVGAGAEALADGADAVFWNPAGTGFVDGERGEAVVLELRGPAGVEIGGAAAAATLRVGDRYAVTAGYQHVGLAGMYRTTTSPDTEGELRLGENVVRLGAAWMARQGLWGGVVVEHWRSGLGGNGTRLGGGVAYRSPLPWRPGFGFAIYTGDGSPRWIAATELKRPIPIGGGAEVAASYGLTGDGRLRSPGHRGAFTAAWRDRVIVSAGLSAEPNGETTHLEPLIEARLRLGPYTLSVVREWLASDFGAAHYLGIGVVF